MTGARSAYAGTVERAFRSQDELIEDGTRCTIDPERLASIGGVLGSQVRIERNDGEHALYTVADTRHESPTDIVRMGRNGRTRVGTTEEFDAVVRHTVPHPSYTDEQARRNSEFVERLDDPGNARLAVLAPHGGMIERDTDRQAELTARRFDGGSATAWRCKGWRDGGGAFERWHIASTDVHRRSFPKLDSIADRGFDHAVSFHGFGRTGVIVGGGAPKRLKREVRAAIEKRIGGGFDVRIASDGPYDGDSPENVVNWVTESGSNGVQIEQGYEARSAHWREIARAVTAVYERL